MTRFRQRSIPYQTRVLLDEWDTIFFMQHYGIPTRFVWTGPENPMIGLHFALMGAPYTVSAKGNISYREPATVWILDPHEME